MNLDTLTGYQTNFTIFHLENLNGDPIFICSALTSNGCLQILVMMLKNNFQFQLDFRKNLKSIQTLRKKIFLKNQKTGIFNLQNIDQLYRYIQEKKSKIINLSDKFTSQSLSFGLQITFPVTRDLTDKKKFRMALINNEYELDAFCEPRQRIFEQIFQKSIELRAERQRIKKEKELKRLQQEKILEEQKRRAEEQMAQENKKQEEKKRIKQEKRREKEMRRRNQAEENKVKEKKQIKDKADKTMKNTSVDNLKQIYEGIRKVQGQKKVTSENQKDEIGKQICQQNSQDQYHPFELQQSKHQINLSTESQERDQTPSKNQSYQKEEGEMESPFFINCLSNLSQQQQYLPLNQFKGSADFIYKNQISQQISKNQQQFEQTYSFKHDNFNPNVSNQNPGLTQNLNQQDQIINLVNIQTQPSTFQGFQLQENALSSEIYNIGKGFRHQDRQTQLTVLDSPKFRCQDETYMQRASQQQQMRENSDITSEIAQKQLRDEQIQNLQVKNKKYLNRIISLQSQLIKTNLQKGYYQYMDKNKNYSWLRSLISDEISNMPKYHIKKLEKMGCLFERLKEELDFSDECNEMDQEGEWKEGVIHTEMEQKPGHCELAKSEVSNGINTQNENSESVQHVQQIDDEDQKSIQKCGMRAKKQVKQIKRRKKLQLQHYNKIYEQQTKIKGNALTKTPDSPKTNINHLKKDQKRKKKIQSIMNDIESVFLHDQSPQYQLQNYDSNEY